MTDIDQDLDKLAEQLGETLRQQELDVPAEVAERLQAARRQAVTHAEKNAQRKARLWPRVAGAGAAVSAGLVFAVAVLLFLQSPVDSLPRMDDVELAAAQDAELLDELEFLAWMVALEEPDDIPKSG